MEDSMQLWWRLASGMSDPAGNYKKVMVMVMFHRLINVVIAGTHKRSVWGLGYDPFALLTPAEAFSSLKDDVSGKAWRFPRFITMWQDSSPFLSFWVVVEFRRFHPLNDSLRSKTRSIGGNGHPILSRAEIWGTWLQTGCIRRWIPKTLGWFWDSTSTNGEYHHRIPVLNQYWNSIHIVYIIYIYCMPPIPTKSHKTSFLYNGWPQGSTRKLKIFRIQFFIFYLFLAVSICVCDICVT